jgi:DNA-directed RNA polymerase subunit M/transcription elongation factor TFIIS
VGYSRENMHTNPMSESEGTFKGWKKDERPCPKCGADQHFWRLWESSDGAYEDEKHKCEACGKTWWVEGPDA